MTRSIVRIMDYWIAMYLVAGLLSLRFVDWEGPGFRWCPELRALQDYADA